MSLRQEIEYRSKYNARKALVGLGWSYCWELDEIFGRGLGWYKEGQDTATHYAITMREAILLECRGGRLVAA